MPSTLCLADPATWKSVAFDRVIVSPFAIAGATAVSHGDAPDLIVRQLAATTVHEEDEPSAPYAREEGSLRFAPPGIARYHCGPAHIAIAPDRDAPPGDIEALLAATALPASVWLQRRYVLHAAAVRLAGQDVALAIAGPSGSGKSTVAAALLKQCADLVADDSVALDEAGDAVLASGLAAGYHLGGSARDRMFHRVTAARSIRSAKLGAIVVLTRDGAPGLRRLDRVAAIGQVLAHRHRGRIPDLLGLRADNLRFCVFLARGVPVYAWHRRWGADSPTERELAVLAGCTRG